MIDASQRLHAVRTITWYSVGHTWVVSADRAMILGRSSGGYLSRIWRDASRPSMMGMCTSMRMMSYTRCSSSCKVSQIHKSCDCTKQAAKTDYANTRSMSECSPEKPAQSHICSECSGHNMFHKPDCSGVDSPSLQALHESVPSSTFPFNNRSTSGNRCQEMVPLGTSVYIPF